MKFPVPWWRPGSEAHPLHVFCEAHSDPTAGLCSGQALLVLGQTRPVLITPKISLHRRCRCSSESRPLLIGHGQRKAQTWQNGRHTLTFATTRDRGRRPSSPPPARAPFWRRRCWWQTPALFSFLSLPLDAKNGGVSQWDDGKLEEAGKSKDHSGRD